MESNRLVFVGGLHRSGTTLLARCLGRHPAVSTFENTGVPADEGQHLQTVYPTARVFGGPGRFGFAEAAHMTESSPLATAESRLRLLAEWGPHWDLDKPVLVEKSPPNLIRMRFLQALFPDASFVVVLRHPVAVSLATQKWSKTSLGSLLEHWVVAHERFAADRPAVRSLLVLTYEELVADGQVALDRLFAFLALDPVPAGEEIRPDGNASYFAAWRGGNRSPLRRAYRELLLVRRLEPRINAFGYSLRDLERATPAA